jgi:hypothetical protein
MCGRVPSFTKKNMNPSFDRKAGVAMIIFTLLILLTMIIHPAGGNFQHLLQLAPLTMGAHALAIVSLPFAAIGFWGLTRRIGVDHLLSVTAFAFAVLGLIAAALAATTNGLVLPLFIRQYQDASADMVNTLKPLMTYSRTVNLAFDFIYTGAFSLAILLWSIAILSTRRLARWIGGLGIVVAVASAGVVGLGVSPGSLHGFHLFVMGLVVWTIAVSMEMMRNR